MLQILKENVECLLPSTKYPNLISHSQELMESTEIRKVHSMQLPQHAQSLESTYKVCGYSIPWLVLRRLLSPTMSYIEFVSKE